MILYSFFMSSCVWRVRIALKFKGVDYEHRAVSLIKKEQRSDSYRSVNPLGQVPTLIDDDLVLTQSMAILEYLEDKYPEPPLLPVDIKKRAQVRLICEMINSGIQPVQSGCFSRLDELGGPGSGLRWAQETIDRGFKALELVLAGTAGKFCVGDELTLADCCLVPQVFNSQKRFQVDTTQYPLITRLYQNLLEVEAVRLTHPSVMPDCPPDFKA